VAKILLVTNQTGRRLASAARAAMEAGTRGALAAAGVADGVERLRVDLTLVPDEELRALSRQYLGTDHYTDVMSFSQMEGLGAPAVRGGPRSQLLGDIVVSLDRAVEQAARAGHPLATELALLVAHGVLHLLGHADETPTDAAEMRRLERQALTLAGIELALSAEPTRMEG
jgi:probable rRNA maturation factor